MFGTAARAAASRVLVTVALATVLCAGARAGVQDVIAQLVEVRNHFLAAATQVHAGSDGGAVALLDEALDLIAEIEGALTDPDLLVELEVLLQSTGKAQKALATTSKRATLLAKRCVAAQAVISADGKSVKKKLTACELGAKASASSWNKLGQPIIWPLNGSARFHKAGEEVQIEIKAVGCNEAPVVIIENGTFSKPVDLGTLEVQGGVISFRMGYEEGGATVRVQACGKEATWLVYNKGPKVPKGLPAGFPTNLAPGKYAITVSVAGAGTFHHSNIVLTSLASFVKQFQTALAMVAKQLAGTGCSISTTYQSVQDNSFKAHVKVTCSHAGQSITTTLTLTVQKQ